MSGYLSENVLLASVQVQSMLREAQISLEDAISVLHLVKRKDIPLADAMNSLGKNVDSDKPTVKLGELLFEAGFVGADELDRYLEDSKEAGLPLGRIILLYGKISKEALSACLTAQVMVRDGKVTREQAVRALKTVRRRRKDLEESLSELGFYRQPIRPHTLIGELFIKAGLVEDANVLSALEMALENEMPVGQAMVKKGLIEQACLEIALELQEMVINSTLTEEQAAEALTKISNRGFTATTALTELAIATATQEDCASAWQLLTAAGLVDKAAREAVFTAESMTMQDLCQKLLNAELIDEFTLHNACRCQFLMRTAFLTLEQAIVVLKHCRSRNIPADTALKELNWIAKTRMDLGSTV